MAYNQTEWDNEDKFEKGVEFAKLFLPEEPPKVSTPLLMLKTKTPDINKMAEPTKVEPVQLSLFDLPNVKCCEGEQE